MRDVSKIDYYSYFIQINKLLRGYVITKDAKNKAFFKNYNIEIDIFVQNLIKNRFLKKILLFYLIYQTFVLI